MSTMTYNETTYAGRLQKFIKLTNPFHLLHKEHEIHACIRTLSLGESTEETRKCRAIVSACVHPTTGNIVPFYGRMAAYGPVNIPICAGLLFAPSTLPHLIGWQWMNQTYNAIFNHCNAAKGNKTSESGGSINDSDHGALLRGYLGAVFVSVGLSVGLTTALKRAHLRPRLKSFFQAAVPYTAVASAGVANVGLMRMRELDSGIPVTTSDGRYVGHSRVAARKALTETCISRAVLSGPILLLPPPLIALALKCRALAINKALKAAVELSCLTFGIFIGLPIAVALYPQTASLPVEALEWDIQQEIKNLQDPPKMVIFNKGL